MKGLFVDSTYKLSQGMTDFGYYIDGNSNPSSADDLEEMVDNDEAYFVEIFPIQNQGVHIRLTSENRSHTSELKEEIGFRSRGLNSTLYKSTGTPVRPSSHDGENKKDESIAAFAEYTLENADNKGLEAENFELDELLDYGTDF
ncbi:MAG: hypothetical protein ACI977_000836 [Candidatus Nanohaloarchaea archaeon]